MAATVTFLNSFYTDLGNNNIDLGADTFKCLLMTSSHTTNVDTQNRRDDIEANEISGTGYTAGGQTLTSVTWTQDDANDRTIFDADNPTWTTATFTARYAAIYKSRGGVSSADELVCIIDFGGDQSVSGATFQIQFNAIGVFAFQQG